MVDSRTLFTDKISHDEIMKYFPMPKPRRGQLESIKFAIDAFNGGKKYVVLEMPTGSGKSVIGITIAKYYQSAYYLTVNKYLQDQLSVEFGHGGKYGQHLVDLKGRNAYECTYYRLNANQQKDKDKAEIWRTQYYNCAEGLCRKHGKSKYESCISESLCPYFVKVDQAMLSPICSMNFAAFLHQIHFTDRFGQRELLIIDECHAAESQLMNFITLTITDLELGDLKIPEYDEPEDYAKWLCDNCVIAILSKRAAEATSNQDIKRVDSLNATINKMRWFIKEMNDSNHDKWVCECGKITGTQYNKVVFKPVYVKRQAFDYLLSMGARVLMMSATVLNAKVLTSSLGIGREEYAAKRLPSYFPIDNRPIYYRPAAKITGGQDNQNIWGPKLISAVDDILETHKDVRGIIHTHNFAIARLILASSNYKNRLLFQEDFINKSAMVDEHRRRTNSVIIAPAMHEGISLDDDLSRFQIVCKVPFPNFYEDKQLAARKELDGPYYNWVVALKLVQSVGRSIRSDTDWAKTYILDGSFMWWYKYNSAILPAWFKDAIIW